MKRPYYISLVLLLLISSAAFAEVPVARYHEFIKTQPTFTNYLVGIGRGIFWANTSLKTNNQKPLFCMPDNLALDKEIILTLIDKEIRSPSSVSYWKDDTPVEFIMVIAFQKKFPCK